MNGRGSIITLTVTGGTSIIRHQLRNPADCEARSCAAVERK